MTGSFRDIDKAITEFNDAVTSAGSAVQVFADQLHPEKLVGDVPLRVRVRASKLWAEHPDLGLLDVLAMAEKDLRG